MASKRSPPPEKVPASIAAGKSPMPADREIDAPSRFGQFIGYLAAGAARAHHEDRARRERSGIAVLARVELNDIGGKAGRELRDPWSLIRAGGDHYVSRPQLTVIGEDHVAADLRARPERQHVDTRSEGRVDPRAIVLDEAQDVVLVRKAVRVVPRVGVAGQRDAPVRELEHERVPPLRAPVFRHPRALQDEVLLAALLQVIAHGEAGLAPANDDGLDALHHNRAIPSRLLRLESSRASRVTPNDELLVQKSTQLAGRRAGGFRSLLFKLSAYLRALQDDVHLAGELVDDVHWCLCRREQTGPDNHGNAWHSRFGNGGHARKQRTPRWEQRREGAKPAFLYQRNDRRTGAYDQLNACAQ